VYAIKFLAQVTYQRARSELVGFTKDINSRKDEKDRRRSAWPPE
jgi:hypothetical protein